MDPVPEEMIRHYESVDEGRRITEGLGQLELVRTQEVLRRHLPDRRLTILDVGGAKGVHAQWLAEEGHDVRIIDPVPGHVEAARQLVPTGGRITAEVGDGRRLRAADRSVDVALVLGPLYHLTDRDDRLRVLREAARVVVDEGLIFAAAISRFASLFDGLAREFLFDTDFRDVVESDLSSGRHSNPDDRPHWFTTAYFHRPDELRAEVEEAGLVVIGLVGVEGLAGWLPHLADRWDDAESREAILFAARAVEAEPSLLGLSAHMLVVAQPAR